MIKYVIVYSGFAALSSVLEQFFFYASFGIEIKTCTEIAGGTFVKFKHVCCDQKLKQYIKNR